MSADPRFDVRPPRTIPPHARAAWHPVARPAVIIPPPLRRETAQPRPAWRPGDVVLPATVDLDDDGDLPTLASQLDHDPAGEP